MQLLDMKIFSDELYRKVGNALAGKRQKTGMSQDALAGHVGVTRVTIANIEAGRQRPPLATLYAIASALDMKLHEVLPDIPKIKVSVDVDWGTPSTGIEE
ncbi:antitoxin HipB [Poriferisphaera corsica]|uniref:Antitoxin HipB n=1 Tax=Poriferisphaera corsica TaxID=2528020 RepID=A0A517YVP7_9BACT|nr:helix-turn-helix transcriptional regulator [Poriferisphaera corsica]QDU34290.1 antitoxin HipB [Poriferisphaera corsica]